VEGECEPLEPQLANGKLGNHVLKLVASGMASTGPEAATALRTTLTGRRVWGKKLDDEEFCRNVEVSIEDLVRAGALERDGQGRLSVNAFGRALTTCGICIETGRAVAQWVEQSRDRYWEELDLILALALTKDGRTPYVSMSSHEYECAGYVERLRDERRTSDWQVDTPLNRLLNAPAPPLFEEMKAIKVALFLKRWIELSPVHEIEEEFSTMAGQIAAAAEQMGWLADAAIEMAKTCGHAEHLCEQVRQVADRLRFGATEQALEIAGLRIDGLNRAKIAGLAAARCATAESIAQTTATRLASIVGDRVARALKKRFPGPSADAVHDDSSPLQLVVDDRRPGIVLLGNKQIRLPERPYRLIRLLADRPQECVTYDEIYNELWGPDIFVENNQMHQHKSEILRRTSDALPKDYELIRTVPKRGFVLAVPAEKVSVVPLESVRRGVPSPV